MQGFVDNVQVDYIVNGQGESGIAVDVTNGRYSLEPKVGFDPGILRPVIQTDGQRYCYIKTGHMIRNAKGEETPESKFIPLQRLVERGMVPYTFNASALPYQTWLRIDRDVIRASRQRLQAWDDLAAANSYGGFDGMSVTAIAREAMTDPGDAKVDMETLTDDFNDASLLTPDVIPLPIIHAGSFIPQRRLAVSRNAGLPLDTTQIEMAARRCSETLEKMTIGETDFSGLTIGSSTTFANRGIYGFKTQADRITKTDLTDISTITEGTSQSALKDDVVEMIKLAFAQNFFGPFVLYYNSGYDEIMQSDYWIKVTSGGAAPTKTVSQRIKEIEGIQKVQRLDMLSSSSLCLLLVQMTSETVRAINGMEFVPVQWTEQGGARIMIRVMGIKVPDLRSQYVGTSASTRKCGIVHGTTA